jgi:kinesin family protein 2/24
LTSNQPITSFSEKQSKVFIRVKVDLTKYVEEHNFVFDHAYTETTSNQQLYNHSVRPLVMASLDGVKITCFAYGQTGSGKTFTMMGDNNKTPGLFLLAAQDLFNVIAERGMNYTTWVSFYEIYCGKLYDLLNNRNLLFPREDAKQNINIVGLSEKPVSMVADLMNIIAFGMSERTTSSTSSNVDSSRSHAILQIYFKDASEKICGKLAFIDLAGSERASDAMDQNKQTRIDGAEINKSLLALKECIRALDHDQKHLPFRGSKLTMVLKDSFIGNCKTLMIANISPTLSCCEHSLNTLRYADRVKELKKGSQGCNQFGSLSDMLMLPRKDCPKQSAPVAPPKQHKDEPLKDWKLPNNSGIQIQLTNANSEKIVENIKNISNIMNCGGKNNKMNPSNKENVQHMCEEHERLIEIILNEEEELIAYHRNYVDKSVENIKSEMSLLQNVDQPNSDVNDYVHKLNSLLAQKADDIAILRGKLRQFAEHLQHEKKISSEFQQFKQEDENLLEMMIDA